MHTYVTAVVPRARTIHHANVSTSGAITQHGGTQHESFEILLLLSVLLAFCVVGLWAAQD